MNTKAKFTEDELQDVWSALAYFVSHYPTEGAQVTKRAMTKLIAKIRKEPKRKPRTRRKG